MNPRARRTALDAIAAIAMAASVNALAHSYAGLCAWARNHRLTGWQAVSPPAEIDVFLAWGNSRSTSPTWTGDRSGSGQGGL